MVIGFVDILIFLQEISTFGPYNLGKDTMCIEDF